jgi:hypothetical protein
MTSVEELLRCCRENGRICPRPQQWNELYQLLVKTAPTVVSQKPRLPLILAAWSETSDQEKQERLEQHVRWAYDHATFDPVAKYLRSLPEDKWHHAGD